MEVFYSLCITALLKLSPLLFCSLAVAVAFKAGLWNIGAEGQFLMGALAAAAVGVQAWELSPFIWIPLILISSMAAAALWGGIAGLFRVSRNVPEVITTILLNFIALELISFSVHGPLQESARTYPISDEIHANTQLPVFGKDLVLHPGILFSLITAVVIYILIFYTRFGFKLRALGSNEKALHSAGISVKKLQLLTLMISGGLAGIGGGIEIVGVSHRLFEKFSPGYGFAAIAIALLGRLHPLWIILSSLFFAFLYSGASALERVAQIPSVTLYIVQALILFGVLFIGLKKNGQYGY